MLESLGHSKVILKCDQEPAMLSLKDSVNREARADVVMAESPEYESKSNVFVLREEVHMVQGKAGQQRVGWNRGVE